MLGLLLIAVLLAAAGISIAYRFSSAAKLKSRIQDSLSPFEELDSETRGLQQALKNETESLTNQYLQGIYASRLKRISLDELKKYATGMRLQALKDVGIRTVADLQGWNEYRVSQVRGIGPKSASAIVHSVAAATTVAKSVPIPRPSPPFVDDTERQLMQALYRQRWFGAHVSDQAAGFSTIVTSHQCARDAILAKATFVVWLWRFGANATTRRTLEQGNAMIEALADQGLRATKEKLARALNDGRTIFANRVPVEFIIQDFNEERAFYDVFLNTRFGASSCRTPEWPRSQAQAANLPPSDIVHIEFGRVVPGPPPIPAGGVPTNSKSPETRPPESDGPFRSNPTTSPEPDIVHVEFGRVVPGPPPKPTGTGSTSSDPASIGPPQSEKLFSVSVSSAPGRGTTDFTLPSPQRSAESSDLRWLRRGEAIQVQGQNLDHGLIYVGQGLHDEQHYAVNPELPAKPGDLTSTVANEFYASYSLLTPERRSIYLAWLSAGAGSPTSPDFGMLYFYGIERRLLDLLQARIPDPPGGELEQLLQEVQRLSDLFKDKPGSVTHCCSRLLDFAAACVLDRVSVPQLPKEWMKTWELPFIIRYGIGWFIRDRKTIPVDWALRWAYVEPTIYLRTPATRCPQEFEASFAAVYQKKFGDGLLVPANKKKLQITYQPGWPMHFGREIRLDFAGIPDVAALTAPQQTLKGLVEEATAEIDGYSRYIGRNPAKSGSLEAYLILPLCLWPSAAADRWRQFRASLVEPIQPLSLESLLRELNASGEPLQAKIPEIAVNLSHALVGFEPDILAGARRPKPSEMIVLFPLTSEPTAERATSAYKEASLIIALAACVALADGHASEDESATVEGMIASWDHLHIDLRSRLRAQYRLQVRSGIGLTSLKSRLANLPPEARMQAAMSLCSLAAADGEIAAAEVKLLEQIYRALELEPKLLYTHLHLGQQQVCEPDAQISSDRSGRIAYAVDTTRLAALRRETDQVTALLAEVFAEEEPPASSAEPVSPDCSAVKSSDDVLLPGLDPRHQRFLEDLLRRGSWTRAELQTLAAQSQIMLDGALERINDASFDLLGEPITEGNDPVYVQQNILEATK